MDALGYHLMAALTDTAIRAAKPKQKPYKLFDERGLFLLVKPNGARLWRFKYVLDGREKLISFGDYRDVPLRRAREKRDEARRLVADGVDPSAERKAETIAQADTFRAVADEWLELQSKSLADETLSILRGRLTSTLYPAFGSGRSLAPRHRNCSPCCARSRRAARIDRAPRTACAPSLGGLRGSP